MIDIARATEQDNPLGITYHVSDIQDLIKSERNLILSLHFIFLIMPKHSSVEIENSVRLKEIFRTFEF